MSLLLEVLDVPSDEVLEMSSYKHKFFDKEGVPYIMDNIKGEKKKCGSKPVKEMIECDEDHFLDFLHHCMDWNPLTRFTPDQALRHIWVLEGLPKNVLYHHCKMYDIEPEEVPEHLIAGTGLEQKKS
jgi:dual specificity tyrosine-phosphorylation-regulated kinase 2/3/4